MSKLNYNNIDVQRILNVLNEIHLKFLICSFMSYGNLSLYFDEIKTKITNQELLRDIEDHYEKIKIFREKHIEIQEEEKDEDKNSQEEEEEDEEGQGKEKEVSKKERHDLKEIEENTSDETKALAKSTRNFCRKYYRDPEFIELVKTYKTDPDITDFMDKFESNFLTHYQKKTKMTLEEEESETKLNTLLRQKINDLQDQIKTKNAKYEKLKKERSDFKAECQQKINDINNEIQKLTTNTTNDLNALAEKINKELNDKKEQNDKELEGLRKEHNQAIEDFNEKKKKDNEDETAFKAEYLKHENALRLIIGEYDGQMKRDKADIEEKNKQKESLNILLATNKTELATVENKYKVFNENFLMTQLKCKEVDYDNKVKERAVEWMQAQFRGFWTRKTMRKKFKFLNVLRTPKIVPIDDGKDKGKKKKK